MPSFGFEPWLGIISIASQPLQITARKTRIRPAPQRLRPLHLFQAMAITRPVTPCSTTLDPHRAYPGCTNPSWNVLARSRPENCQIARLHWQPAPAHTNHGRREGELLTSLRRVMRYFLHATPCAILSGLKTIIPGIRAEPRAGDSTACLALCRCLLSNMGLIAETRQAIQDSPRGVFNWYLLLNTAIFALSGIGRGFDEGKIPQLGVLHILSSIGNIACLVVQSRFRIKFGLDQQSPEQYANSKGWVVSIFTAGMALGCLAVGCPSSTADDPTEDPGHSACPSMIGSDGGGRCGSPPWCMWGAS